MFRRPPLRALASLLAAVALASAAVQPVMACEMGLPGAERVAESSAHDPHAHHAMPVTSDPVDASLTPDAAPATPAAPAMPACDHLVGCAVMVVASAPTVTVVPVTVPEAAPRWTAAHLDAPVLALEPPPPRA